MNGARRHFTGPQAAGFQAARVELRLPLTAQAAHSASATTTAGASP
jgi:hypothetical protein